MGRGWLGGGAVGETEKNNSVKMRVDDITAVTDLIAHKSR